MKRTLWTLLLLLSAPAFAADGVVSDPLEDPISDPQPSLGSDSGAMVPEEPIHLTPGIDSKTARPYKETITDSSLLTPTEVREAISGDDEVFWSLHEGGRNHVQIGWVANAFPERDFDPGAATKNITVQGGKFQYLYFPLDGSYGRFGLGPSGGYYRASSSETNTGSLRLLAYGAKANYELQFWEAQLFVPFVEFGFERLRQSGGSYKANPTDTASVALPPTSENSSFYSLGLLLYLNRLEHDAGSRAIASSGIRKFYLAYAAENREGLNHNLGVRFEF